MIENLHQAIASQTTTLEPLFIEGLTTTPKTPVLCAVKIIEIVFF